MTRLLFACVALGMLAADPLPSGVEELAARLRKSIYVITAANRDGRSDALGTGFAVGPNLIATNFHVIGEGRAIKVETADGKALKVLAVHASDRKHDLAILRVDATELPVLERADSSRLKDGQAVVALGNPQGLKFSVVAGVVSGQREIEGVPLIQLAIPVEPGNSGGPVVDAKGRAIGVVTMKSLVTANLGFAVGINQLKPLLDKPNSVPMERWLTIGALDPEDWQVVGGAQWRQRAGRLQVEGSGSGFGGRSLCLSQRPTPALPYEVSVSVKLDDERGAAGLIFASDGGDNNWGFYPSGGQVRLTRFNGPDVLSWQIVEQKASPAYRPGEWNTFKVRIEKTRLRCFVNDQPFAEHELAEPLAGKIGLAKFRDTKAEFKHLQRGAKLADSQPAATSVERIVKSIGALKPGQTASAKLLSELQREAASQTVLRERARALEQQAEQLRRLAAQVAVERTLTELAKLARQKDDKLDLVHAALLIARIDNEELDVEAYRRDVERLADKLRTTLPAKADDATKLARLGKFLFEERGFHGSRGDYYHRSNSYLNEVLDDREGLPIALAVLHLELGRRIGLPLEGLGLPGQFMVRYKPTKGAEQIVDVFEGGTLLTREKAAAKSKDISGYDVPEIAWAGVTKRTILVRMLTNLLSVARGERDLEGGLRYLDAIVAVEPESANERFMRAGLRIELGRSENVEADLDWLADKQPEDVDSNRVEALRRRFREGRPSAD